MAPQWLHLIAVIYSAASVFCALLVLIDILAGHRQQMAVMNMVWPITVLYFGPIGLWAYWRMGRTATKGNGMQGSKEKPFWQSVFVGSTHCRAGCALGDVLAEWGSS